MHKVLIAKTMPLTAVAVCMILGSAVHAGFLMEDLFGDGVNATSDQLNGGLNNIGSGGAGTEADRKLQITMR